MLKNLTASTLFLVSIATLCTFVISSWSYPSDYPETAKETLEAINCSWATGPLLQDYPSKDALQKCVADLINAIRDVKNESRSKDSKIQHLHSEINSLKLRVESLQLDIELLRFGAFK